MTAHTPLPQPLVESIRKALTRNALPGEVHGLTRESEREAAEFLAQVAAQRKPGQVEIEIQSTGGEAGNRRMRIGIVNDDMRAPQCSARSQARLGSCSPASFASPDPRSTG